MVSLPTAPFLISLMSSPPSTPAWRFLAHHAGSYLTTAVLPSASLLWSSPSLAQGRATLLLAVVSPPSQQHLRLNTTSASTATPSVMAATSLAITPYAAPMHHAVAGVLAPTPPGITLVPLPPATQRVALAHTPRLSVSHAPALTRHILPSALSVLPPSPVRRVGRMTKCTSPGGLSPSPLAYIWWLFFHTWLPAREALCFLWLVMLCATKMAPLLSLHRGFGTSLFPHGIRPTVRFERFFWCSCG